MLEHLRKTRYAPCRQGIHGASADAIDANLAWTQIVRQVACAGLQRCFGNSHYIVMRHYLFRAVITHAHDAATLSHQRSSPACQGNKGIGADIVGCSEGLTARVKEITLQRFFRRESD